MPSQKDVNPSTDFYKKLALDCSSQYIAVDVFFINDQYCDIASVSCIAKFSGGCLHRINGLANPQRKNLLEAAFARYLTRKIGFEAVMRVRCTR
jgi:protein transport protein SEC24